MTALPRTGLAVRNTAAHTPGFLQLCAAFCYFVLLLLQFCLLFANTHSHKAPTHSSPVLQLHAHGAMAALSRVGVAVRNTVPTHRAFCNFVLLLLLLLLLPTFRQYPQPNAPTYG